MYEISQQSNHRYIGNSDIVRKLDNRISKEFSKQRADNAQLAKSSNKQFAIAAVVLDPQNEDKFLVVKRPSNAKSLPDVWGLPAIVLKDNEQPEIAVTRLAWEKLNTQIELLGCLGLDSIDRGEYKLILMDVVVKLIGQEPSVWKAPTEQTKYVQQRWTNGLSILQEAALKGSICSRILLHSQGFPY